MRPNEPKDVWRNVLVRREDECWNWQGSTKEGTLGYGQMKLRGKNCYTHRVAYEAWYGVDPGVRQVLHRCDNPRCCNPHHLWLGTAADNMADKVRKGRQAHGPGSTVPTGDQHPRARVTAAEVAQIKARHSAGERQVDLAKEFGLSKSGLRYVLAER